MLIHFTVISQSLTPSVFKQNKETLFCFTLEQRRTIAKEISSGQYCDSISRTQEQVIFSLGKEVILKDSICLLLSTQKQNQLLMIENLERGLKESDALLLKSKRELRRARWTSRAMGVALIIFSCTTFIQK